MSLHKILSFGNDKRKSSFSFAMRSLNRIFAVDMKINLLSDEDVALLKKYVSEASNIVLCCHKSPDGDALGSCLALAEYLKQVGKQPMVAIPDAYPDFLQWLPNTEKVVRYDKHKEEVEEAFEKADLVFCLDINDAERLHAMKAAFDKANCKVVMIDHHVHPSLDCDLSVSFPRLSSTSEIVFRIVWQLGCFEDMNKHFATAVYTGMMTDTGAFTYNSSYPEIYFIISQLLTKRIDKDRIYRKVYNNYSDWCIRMRGYIMFKKLNVLASEHACYFTITRDDMSRFHFIKGDAEGLVNEPLRIKGMRMSISLREDTDRENVVWVSLRSVDNFYCDVIAREFFNGGGHPNAAGGNLNCSISEAEAIVRKAIKRFAELYK